VTYRWSVETTDQFDHEFKKLDRPVQRRVLHGNRSDRSADLPSQSRRPNDHWGTTTGVPAPSVGVRKGSGYGMAMGGGER